MIIEYKKYNDTSYINGIVKITYSLEEYENSDNYDIFLEKLERAALEYAVYPAINNLKVVIEICTVADMNKLLKILVGEI